MEEWFIEGLQVVRNFMLWDGVAILAFGGILALGLRIYNLRPFLIGAWCIPVASLIRWAIVGQPFLTPIAYIIMAAGTVIVLMPIEVHST